jgi:hypothetical protein
VARAFYFMNFQNEKAVTKSNSIVWNIAAGFSLMIIFSWLTELLHLPHLIFGEPFAPNWERAALRTLVILVIWGWVYWITRRVLKRLHHLEEFLRICGWCRKVCDKDQWLTMEAYFSSKFDTRTTHGMCPDCLAKAVNDLDKDEKPTVNSKP